MPTIKENFQLGNWPIHDDAVGLIQKRDYGYIIEHRRNHSWWAVWRLFEYDQSELIIQIKIERIHGTLDSFYGFHWGLIDINHFNYMMIYLNNAFALGEYINQEWHHLTYRTTPPISRRIGFTDDIGLTNRNGFLDLYVNGVHIFNHNWNGGLSGNNIGFLVGPSMKIKFTELTITGGEYVFFPTGKIIPPPIKRTRVVSSNLSSVGYDNKSQILEIEFKNGAVYQYYDVPQQVYVELMNAESHGRYFYVLVRDSYRYQLVIPKNTQQFNNPDIDNDIGNDFDPYDDINPYDDAFGQWRDQGSGDWFFDEYLDD